MVATLELVLTGSIGEDKPISLASVRKQLAARSFDAIHFEIRSHGGCVSQSFAIYNLLRALPVPIAATASGPVYSGGLIIYMAASLRKAKGAAEFLLHPTSKSRHVLPDSVTAHILQTHADDLAKTDRRVVDLFTDRTGFQRDWFEREIASEDPLSDADAIQAGFVHHFAGLTPACDPTWPDTAQRVMKESRNLFLLPSYMTSQNYYEACRCAAFFEYKKAGVDIIRAKDGAHAPHLPAVDAVPAPPRLTIIAS
jgi:ATP-dependent protease ClpP protease subunit